MFFGRIMGWLLAGLGVVALGGDGLRWLETGLADFGALGAFWAQLDSGSLAALQLLCERYLWPPLWDPGLVSLLALPAAPLLILLGLGLVLLFRRPPGKPRARFGALA